MPKDAHCYAVLTGDIVDSSRVGPANVPMLSDTLKKAFAKIESMAKSPVSPAFEQFRGDSFQGVLKNPVAALQSSLMIRACLRSAQPEGSKVSWDTRIAIGIGSIAHLSENATAGDGEAYRNSGPVLDAFKNEERLSIHTPWNIVNEELNVDCALLDAVIAKWTPTQAETILMLLDGKTREEISEELGISQAAVHYRVRGAGWFAVDKFMIRYTLVIKNHLDNKGGG